MEAVEAKLYRRAAWVVKQQRYFAQLLPRTPQRCFVAGETHRYLGRHYKLKIVLHHQDCVKPPAFMNWSHGCSVTVLPSSSCWSA